MRIGIARGKKNKQTNKQTAGSVIQTADGCVRLMENYDQPVNVTMLCHLGSKHQLVLSSWRVAVRNTLIKRGRSALFILILVSWELGCPQKLGCSLSNDQCASVTWLDLLYSSLGVYSSQIRNKFWSGYDCLTHGEGWLFNKHVTL